MTGFPFQDGERLQRRKAAVARAHSLVADHPGVARLERLAALSAEVRERWATMPRPIMDHLQSLSLAVQAEIDLAAELGRVEDAFKPTAIVAAPDDEEPPL